MFRFKIWEMEPWLVASLVVDMNIQYLGFHQEGCPEPMLVASLVVNMNIECVK